MERLTYKNENDEWSIKQNTKNAIATNSNGTERYYTGKPIDRLAELEEKFESGKLVELPCSVGDTVYCLIATRSFGTLLTSGQAFARKVTKVIFDGKKFEIYCERTSYNDNTFEGCNFYGYWKDTVFATKVQAEARLKELQED